MPETGAGGAVAGQRPDDPLEDDLGEVLGVLAPTNPERDIAVDRADELIVEAAERLGVTGAREEGEVVDRGVWIDRRERDRGEVPRSVRRSRSASTAGVATTMSTSARASVGRFLLGRWQLDEPEGRPILPAASSSA